MNEIDFDFSDPISGRVASFDKTSDSFILETSGRRKYCIKFSSNTKAWIINKLNKPRQECIDQMRSMFEVGGHVFACCIFYPEKNGHAIEATARDIFFHLALM